MVGQPVRLVPGQGHVARAHQRQGVLHLGFGLAQLQRGQQALRQRVAGGGAAGGQEHRHAVGPEGVPHGLAVGVGIPAEDQKVVPAPAVAHGQTAAQRRRDPKSDKQCPIIQ